MTSIARYGAAASLMAAAAALSSPAFAATPAGSTITNTVSVSYRVGGVTQPSLSASDTFTVDRKVNLTVVEEGSATTQVSPGQTAAVTSFLISNLTNAPMDIALAASNLGGDNYNVSNFKYYADTNGNGSLHRRAPISRSPISTRSRPRPAISACSCSPTFRSAGRPAMSPTSA